MTAMMGNMAAGRQGAGAEAKLTSEPHLVPGKRGVKGRREMERES